MLQAPPENVLHCYLGIVFNVSLFYTDQCMRKVRTASLLRCKGILANEGLFFLSVQD